MGLASRVGRGLVGVLALWAVGCAAVDPTDNADAQAAFEQDREAILAMTGDYQVSFHFEEFVALAPGYELVEDKNSGGMETVFVVEDTGDLIRLQHVLVVGPSDNPIVVKHWRQDWRYEPARILEYAGHERWTTREISAEEARGAWSQTVYQVDDSPRYAAVARWRHGETGVSTWESPASWRPLPRRDATTRDDYHVIDAVNRHTITPWGWAHEQDNEKVALSLTGARTPLVREVGVNAYRQVEEFPTAPVVAYWEETQDFWAVVRDRWDALEASSDVIAIAGKEPDDPIYGPILSIVAELEAGDLSTDDAVAAFDAVLAKRVTVDEAVIAPDAASNQLALSAAY